MAEKLETIFDYGGEDGDRRVVVSVDRDNRLHVNGEPIVTESKLTLAWWVSAAIIVAGFSTLALSVIELGRAAGRWM